MPATSEKQRQLMAIAEHHPEKLHKENRGVLKMSHQQLHDFASTKGLPSKGKRPHGKHTFTSEHLKKGYMPGSWMEKMSKIRGKG